MKRIFDFTLSILGVVILLPVILVICIIIKLDSRGPAFYRQERIGRFEAPFIIYKFRTMYVNSDKGSKITVGESDSRITRVGYYLRKLKLDELPQLFNVIKGDMSLVGPRPEVREYIDLYPKDIRMKVLSIRPGITDNASIQMYNESEVLERFEDPEFAYINHILPLKQKIYLEYVNNRSLLLDIKIIFKTIMRVLVSTK